jgi:hypothetical protein
MKKLFIILLMVFATMSIKSQNYLIGVGYDKGYIVYPNGVRKTNDEILICGQYNKFDGMLSFGLFKKEPSVDIFSVGFYGGHNFGWFTLGGHLGYELMETEIHNMYVQTNVQADNMVFGAYAKATIENCLQFFAFYKLSYDNNSNNKWNDRGFGFGVAIGFGSAKNK